MSKTVFGIFQERINAENAINTFKSEGYSPEDISIIMKDKRESREFAKDTGANVAKGTVTGATTGAALGGLAGLLASTVLPGLGAFFIGGPIAAALGLTGAAATAVSGATTGAVAGGFLGALGSLGLSKEDARMYEERIKEGAILVAVPAREGEEARVMEIFNSNNATDVKSVAAPSEETVEEEYSVFPVGFATVGVKGGKTKGKKDKGKVEKAK